MTSFFEHQAQARRATWWLLGQMLLGMLLVVLVLDFVAIMAMYFADMSEPLFDQMELFGRSLPGYVWATLIIGALVTAFISGVSIYRMLELRQGGSAVAAMLKARRVKRDGPELAERRLSNIVDEMAIAAGIAAPAVYVMQSETSINALAAGWSPNDAVIVVTQGALEQLDREQLQAVIAHEYSHILNGDMRLNMHLLGVLAGLGIIGLLGLRLLTEVFVLGLAIGAVGFAGYWWGERTRASISRQREFLADASAVAFTRNPHGLIGALVKIDTQAKAMSNWHARELGHMFFGAAADGGDRSHPPVAERLARLGASAAGLSVGGEHRATSEGGAPGPLMSMLGALQEVGAVVGLSAAPAVTAAMANIGRPQARHLASAHEHMAIVFDLLPPEHWRTGGARVLAYALLLDHEEAARKVQVALLEQAAGPVLSERSLTVAQRLGKRRDALATAVLQFAAPELRAMSDADRQACMRLSEQLAQADRRVSLAEFSVLAMLGRILGLASMPRGKHKTFKAVQGEVRTVLSWLAMLAAQSDAERDMLFGKALDSIGVPAAPMQRNLSLAAYQLSVRELACLSPACQEQLVQACLQMAHADGRVDEREYESVRALCAAIDVPLPPLVRSTTEMANGAQVNGLASRHKSESVWAFRAP